MFNFDDFINKPSIGIFGQITTITPAKTEFAAFEINGDFHEDYKEVNPDSSDVSITSSVIAVFIRNSDLPDYYPKINQGDLIEIDGKNYQIIDVQIHLPRSKKLVLHESSEINN